MKKNIVITTLVLVMVTALVLSAPIALAAFNDHIPSNQGTEIINGNNGCRPPTQAGSVNIDGDFPDLGSGGEIWAGALCCASNQIDEVSGYPTPNQCCNPPDYLPSPPFDPETSTGEHYPGNHCECFALRGYQALP